MKKILTIMAILGVVLAMPMAKASDDEVASPAVNGLATCALGALAADRSMEASGKALSTKTRMVIMGGACAAVGSGTYYYKSLQQNNDIPDEASLMADDPKYTTVSEVPVGPAE